MCCKVAVILQKEYIHLCGHIFGQFGQCGKHRGGDNRDACVSMIVVRVPLDAVHAPRSFRMSLILLVGCKSRIRYMVRVAINMIMQNWW
jgi:hypothetical protein